MHFLLRVSKDDLRKLNRHHHNAFMVPGMLRTIGMNIPYTAQSISTYQHIKNYLTCESSIQYLKCLMFTNKKKCKAYMYRYDLPPRKYRAPPVHSFGISWSYIAYSQPIWWGSLTATAILQHHI